MKKIIIIILALFTLSIYGYLNEYDMDPIKHSYDSQDIDLNISFDRLKYNSFQSELIVTISISNTCDMEKYINPPLLEYYDILFKVKAQNIASSFGFNYWKQLSGDVYKDFHGRAPVFTTIKLESKKEVHFNYNILDYYNLEDITVPMILRLYGLYPTIGCVLVGRGELDGTQNGEVKSNTVRLFLNMESELISSFLIVEPHKWNTAWEKEQSDAGVFTVFLGNIDGYSVKDIKQDTVLFNGTLKPVDIKITGSHKDMKGKVMMLKFKKKEGMEYLGIKEPGDIKKINISGQLNDDKWFHAEAEVEIEGAKEKGNK